MAATIDCLRMVEMTCARLCHELGGLLGTLGNALELAAEARDEEDDALALAEQAARDARSRLRLMQAAWGPGNDPLTVPALLDLLRGLPRAGRIELETGGVAPGTAFPPGVGRVVLNIVLLAAESLPAGGRILLAGASDDLFVRILGPKAAWPAGFGACIADADAAIAAITGPRRFQMPLTALWAHALGVRLSMLMGPAAVGAPPPLRIGGR
jgi:histidine phosphotransferase ChpT